MTNGTRCHFVAIENPLASQLSLSHLHFPCFPHVSISSQLSVSFTVPACYSSNMLLKGFLLKEVVHGQNPQGLNQCLSFFLSFCCNDWPCASLSPFLWSSEQSCHRRWKCRCPALIVHSFNYLDLNLQPKWSFCEK